MKVLRRFSRLCLFIPLVVIIARDGKEPEIAIEHSNDEALQAAYLNSLGADLEFDNRIENFHAYSPISTNHGSYVLAYLDYSWKAAGYSGDMRHGEQRIAVFHNGTLFGRYTLNSEVAEGACRVTARRFEVVFRDGHSLTIDLDRELSDPPVGEINYVGGWRGVNYLGGWQECGFPDCIARMLSRMCNSSGRRTAYNIK